MLAVRAMIIDHLQSNPPPTVAQLGRSLFDNFATLNLDWALVAQTEIGECQLQGFIGGQKPGVWVKRVEALQNECSYCEAIKGRTYQVVASDSSNKDWQTQVWLGKSRIHPGATDAPVGDWPSAGLQHPGCRGSWTLARGQTLPTGVSREFAAWLEELLEARPIGGACPNGRFCNRS